jgi:hypothetical protein
VRAPFGAGCTNIITWPLTYQRRGEECAVLGGFDPSARKFMKPDELSFAVPLALYRKMLAAMETLDPDAGDLGGRAQEGGQEQARLGRGGAGGRREGLKPETAPPRPRGGAEIRTRAPDTAPWHGTRPRVAPPASRPPENVF